MINKCKNICCKAWDKLKEIFKRLMNLESLDQKKLIKQKKKQKLQYQKVKKKEIQENLQTMVMGLMIGYLVVML